MNLLNSVLETVLKSADNVAGANLPDFKDIVEAVRGGDGALDEFLDGAGAILKTDDVAMGVLRKLSGKVEELDGMEAAFRAGNGNVDDVLKALDIPANSDVAARLTGLDDVIKASQEATAQTAAKLDDMDDIMNQTAKEAPGAGPSAAEAAADAGNAGAKQGPVTLDDAGRVIDDVDGAVRNAGDSAKYADGATVVDDAVETGTGVGSRVLGGLKSVATNKWTLGIGTVAGVSALMPGAEDNPEATDGKTIIAGKEVEVSKIPLHLMTDAEFKEYLDTNSPLDPDKMQQKRIDALVDKGLGSVDADGVFTLDQEKWNAARQKYEAHIQDKGPAAPLPDDVAGKTDPSPAETTLGGLQGFFQEIMQFIQQIVQWIGGGGGLFGNFNAANSKESVDKARAVTASTMKQQPQMQPQAQPQVQQPQLSQEQVAEQNLIAEHRGYAESTAEAAKAGQVSNGQIEIQAVEWDSDEIKTGNADYERILEENIELGFDGGSGGILHIDEDEGLMYIHRNAMGEVEAFIVNDHINDIPNLNDIPYSMQSMNGLGNAMLANDRHAENFNPQGGIVKTVEFEDGFLDGKDIKNEELQFKVSVDAQGRYNIAVVNDDFKQNRGAELETAQKQTLDAIADSDPGFDYYEAGGDPIREQLLQDQRNQEIANAAAKGIEDAGDIIAESITRNGMTINIGNNNPTVQMGNRAPFHSPQNTFDQLQQDARVQQGKPITFGSD